MRRAFIASTLLVSAVCPASVGAQDLPSSFDISGVWVLAPFVGDRARVSTHNCYALDYAFANHAMYGRDWIELKLVGVEHDALRPSPEGFDEAHLVLSYTGTYHHYRGFGLDTLVTEVNGQSVQNSSDMDYACALEEIDYALTGELQYSIERNRIYVALEGVTNQVPSYRYETRVVLSGLSNDGEPSYALFPLPTLDALLLSPGWDRETLAGDTDLPGGCNFAGGHLGGLFSNCTVVRYAPLRFEPGNPPADVQPKGRIAGTLLEALPDGTTTNDPIPKAELSLYRQDVRIRDRNQGESAAAYANYLAERTRAREFIATVSPDASGRFSFDAVPLLARDKSSRLQLRAAYTLVVRKAEREELGNDGQMETVFFEIKNLYNLQPDRDGPIYVKAFTGLGAKQDLITNLSELSPNRYKLTEDLAQAQIDAWVNGVETLTPEAQEGLNRAIWAERVVQSGALFAKENLELTLDAFAALVTDLLVPKAFEKGKNLGKAEAVTDLAKAESKGFRQMLSNPGQSLGELKGKMLEEARGRHAEATVYDKVKGGIKSLIIAPLKLGLIKLGVDADTTSAVIDFVEKGLFSVLDIVFKRFLSNERDVGAYEESVKVIVEAIIKSLHGQLFEAFNPSYCALTEPSLLMSVSEMDGWPTSNRPQYELDRDQTVALLSAMNAEASGVLEDAYYARTAAEGFGAAGDALETLGTVAKVPWVILLEKLSKAMKHLANAKAFVSPLMETFGNLPDHVERGALAAFGRQSMSLLSTDPRLGEMVPFNQEPLDRMNNNTYALWDATDRVIAAVQEDRLGDALLEFSGSTPTSVRSLATASFVAIDHLLLVFQGGDFGWSERFVNAGERIESERARTELRLELIAEALLELTLGVMSGDFESPADPAYLRQKAHVANELKSLKTIAGYGVPGIPEFGSLFLPAVAVDVVEFASTTTGLSEVTTANESFRLRVKVRNLSPRVMNNLALRLTMTGTVGDVLVSEAPVQSIGALAAADATFDAGPDEVELGWTLEYRAPLTRGPSILLSLDLLQAGLEPQNVSTRSRGLILRLAESVLDADGDTLPDAWESVHGLDVGADDREGDLDSDGLSNRRELFAETRPDVADTDGDGRLDGEELGLTGGALSNPLLVDTDADGLSDAVDSAPLDSMNGALTSSVGEPIVQVSSTRVRLDPRERLAVVDVTNGGGGVLRWAVVNDNPHLINTTPPSGLEHDEGWGLSVSLPSWITPELTGYTTTIRLVDVYGQIPDSVEITIEVPRAEPGTDGGVGDGGSNPSDGSLPGDGGVGSDGAIVGGPDSGTGPGTDDPNGGGCGCETTAPNSPSSGLWLVGLALAALLARRVPQLEPRRIRRSRSI